MAVKLNFWGFPARIHHASLIFFLVLSAVNGQQPGTPGTTTDPYPYAKFSPSMAIIIAVLVTALFFMGFFSIYIRRCSQSGTTGGSVRATLSMRSRRAAAARGLDASVIETFPTFPYSEVKGMHIGKGALECAVCLNEFEDEETLRLLPKCDHVFHPECIDLWLASHTTCPVCRADLVPIPGESIHQPEELPVSGPGNEGDNVIENVQPQGEVHVTIVPDESKELPTINLLEPPKPDMIIRAGSVRVNRPPRSGSVRAKMANLFPRSHSTGHSIAQPAENLDRYTLRIPDEVRRDIIKRALDRTGSCAASYMVGEGSVKKGAQTGNANCNEEGSSKGGRSYKRLGSVERNGRSDRWGFARMPSFLTRALSTRSKVVAGEGEASTSGEPEKSSGNDTTRKNSKDGSEGNNPDKLPV